MRYQLLAVTVTAGLLAVAESVWAEELVVPLAIEDGGFEPAQIEAPAGARIRLEVTNQSAGVIEFESFELNRERVIQPGQKVSVYVSGLSRGRYEFFDDLHPERRGALVVE